MTYCPLNPLHEFIVIKMIDAPTRTTGGLFIPDAAKADVMTRGTVVKVPDVLRVFRDKEWFEISVKVGDTVLFNRHSSTSFKYEDDIFWFVKERDLYGILRGE